MGDNHLLKLNMNGKRVKRLEIVEKEAVEFHYSMIIKLTQNQLVMHTLNMQGEVWVARAV